MSPTPPPPGLTARPGRHAPVVVHSHLASAAQAPREARRVVDEVLSGAGLGHLSDTATLLVGELAANAVRHGRAPVDLTITLDAERITVAVRDHGRSRQPHLRAVDPAATSGRGLRIVAAASESWGSASAQPGTTVWFTLLVT